LKQEICSRRFVLKNVSENREQMYSLSVCLSLSLSLSVVCLSVCLSVLFVCLSVCLSVCVSVSLSLSKINFHRQLVRHVKSILSLFLFTFFSESCLEFSFKSDIRDKNGMGNLPSSRNLRRDRELYLVLECSWRERFGNHFHENFGKC